MKSDRIYEFDMKNCILCPRHCGVDRTGEKKGFCGQTSRVRVARAALHFWEEPCISGLRGSGTVFFSGCALHCVYCQNVGIANGDRGKRISVERLSDIFLELEEKGAANINLVTAGHFAPELVKALERVKGKELHIPVVYNTGGYEKVETLQRLEGLVDIYLPDFKYMDETLAARYSHAADYPSVACRAIDEMVRQTGSPVFELEGQELDAEAYNDRCDEADEILMKRGTVVRHLLLPGCEADSKAVLSYLHQTYGNRIFISIMNQYTPLPHVEPYPELNRRVTEDEYDRVVEHAIALGIENAFIQEGDTAMESFIPEFSLEGV